jgi:hypothetical protein
MVFQKFISCLIPVWRNRQLVRNDDSTLRLKLARPRTQEKIDPSGCPLEKEIPRKFPNVRWGFVEVGAQWVPYVLNDLTDRFRRKGRSFPTDALAASNMWVACENTDDLAYVLSHAGEDCLMIATDYGHHDPSSELNAIPLL